MTLRAADQFHVGIVVEDFEGTLAQLSETFGYEWCDEMSSPTTVQYADGTTAVVQPGLVYSMNVPRLEIIRVLPGTLWVPASSGSHHLGYWSDDVEVDAAALERGGYAPEVAGMDPTGKPFWAYHRHSNGLRIELVSRALQPVLDEYFATGRTPGTFEAGPAS